MSDRDWILERLRQAVREPRPGPSLRSEVAADWEVFCANYGALGGIWISRLAAIEWPRSAVADDDVAHLLPPSVERIHDPWAADIGVTGVDLAVAETGSLLIGSLPGRRRLNSLAPPIHLAICSRSALVGSFGEAMARIPERTSALISGSSRTADIEGILVRGVHGPRELWLAVLDE